MTRTHQPGRCLVIGSSDSGGGAGIQGDIKALASVGCFAGTVVVGITAQDTTGVYARHDVPIDVIREQLRRVRADLVPDAVKVGTAWSPEVLAVVAEELADFTGPVVVDPVLFSAAGSRLYTGDAPRIVCERLFPLATVVVPNRAEARQLAGVPVSGPRQAAEAIVARGAAAVIITGGGEQDDVADWYYDGHNHHRIDGIRYRNGVGHGAGCAHAAILCGLLALGHALPVAAVRAKQLVEQAVGDGLTEVGHGVHPVDTLGLAARADQLRALANHSAS